MIKQEHVLILTVCDFVSSSICFDFIFLPVFPETEVATQSYFKKT